MSAASESTESITAFHWKFIGPTLTVDKSKLPKSSDTLSPITSIILASMKNSPLEAVDSRWLIDNILNPTFENCRYSMFPYVVYGGSTPAQLNTINEGDCSIFARYMELKLNSFFSNCPYFIIPGTLPPFYGEENFPKYSHVAVIALVHNGIILLDPAFLLTEPIYLLEDNNYEYFYHWNETDQYYRNIRGKHWIFRLNENKTQIQVFIISHDEINPNYELKEPAFHYLLARCSTPEDIKKLSK